MSFTTDLPTEADRRYLQSLDPKTAGISDAQLAELSHVTRTVSEDLAVAARHFTMCNTQAAASPARYFRDKVPELQNIATRAATSKSALTRLYHGAVLPALSVAEREAFDRFIAAAGSLLGWAECLLELVSTASVADGGSGSGAPVHSGGAREVRFDVTPAFEGFQQRAEVLMKVENFVYSEGFRGNVLHASHFEKVKQLAHDIDVEHARLRQIAAMELTTGAGTSSIAMFNPPLQTFAALRDSLLLLLATSQTEDELQALLGFQGMIAESETELQRVIEAAKALDTSDAGRDSRKLLFHDFDAVRKRVGTIKSSMLADIAQRKALQRKHLTQDEERRRKEATPQPLSFWSRWVQCKAEPRPPEPVSPFEEQRQHLLRSMSDIELAIESVCTSLEQKYPAEYSRNWGSSLRRWGDSLTQWAQKVTVVV